MKEGDWECTACGAHNFARRTRCYKCGENIPAEAAAARPVQEPGEDEWYVAHCRIQLSTVGSLLAGVRWKVHKCHRQWAQCT